MYINRVPPSLNDPLPPRTMMGDLDSGLTTTIMAMLELPVVIMIVVVAGVAVFTSYLMGGIISVVTWICHSCYVDLLKLAIMATMIVVVAALHIFSPGRDQLCSSFSSPPKNISAPVQNL